MPSKAPLMDFCRWLARPVLLFYALPWLMVILTLGTLAQADIGLYQAHHRYFSSWVFWWGPLPLPGAWTTISLITISLTAKFMLASPWDRARLGTTLTHLGVLVLLYGGLATALTQQEGFMVIEEGKSAQTLSDYHDRVLKIYKDEALAAQIPFESLRTGRALSDAALPFTLTPLVLCRNCLPEPLEAEDDNRKGMAEKIRLRAVDPEKEDELNLAGLTFDVAGTDDTDGVYISLEDIPMIPRFEKEGATYGIQMGRAERALPFSIALIDFARENYPGTIEARAYHSDVVVRDGDLEWAARIEMNEPLRYRGYTFYQSSFAMTPDGREKTVLSGVRNKGWVFPYAASVIVFAGMCVHLFQRLGKREGQA